MFNIEPFIAHRGASAYAPENTLAAFNKAYELGARAIELDVMMCADGGLFIFHDETFQRATSNGSGKFNAATSDYINTLDAGSWFAPRFSGEKIVSLPEAINWFVTHKVQANFEIKPHPGCAKATTEAFLACLKQHWPLDAPQPLVSCFDHDVMKRCARLAPELPLGLLFRKAPKNWMMLAKEVRAVSIHLDKYWVTKKRIKQMKDAGYQVCIYTVNSREFAARYLALGADAILTDYPDLMDE
ncbi:MAG: glycerophosphodiester phosphodiesterase family protein [Legionella sp.]|nr:glycerophosphodiester phosphodiesterase family protein [Legionella sp.]